MELDVERLAATMGLDGLLAHVGACARQRRVAAAARTRAHGPLV
jgi:hypothetical protein